MINKPFSSSLVLIMLLPVTLLGQNRKPATVAEISSYMGADREQMLYAGAKSEGKLTWYTSLAGDSYKAIMRVFEAKYPAIRLDVYRAGGSDFIVRMMEEVKARRPAADTLETSEDSLILARANQLLQPYSSPHLSKYPEDAIEKADKGMSQWTTIRESYLGFGYNKTQIPANAVPKNFDGLLHPELKGKLSITLNESAMRVIGAMVKVKGEAFVRKLKAQDIKAYTVSSAALADLIASGEIGASPQIFRNHALVSAARGSSVGWVPMELVPTNAGSVAVAAHAPHPHGALLLVDFLLSEAPKVLDKFNYGHPATDYGFKRWYQDQGRSVDDYEKDSAKWGKLAREINQR
jgi:iron(III) transport system substrate-binding protein